MENVFLDVAVNLDLEPVKLDSIDIKDQISQNIADLFPEAPGVTEAIENTIRLEPGRTLLHKNMMHYLTLAWYNHFSVVISPDMIFYTVLCVLAETIKTEPEAYRHLFTDSTEKKRILTTPINGRIDLDQVVAALSKNIAVDASLFTAEFSTTNSESRLAIQAAFCDAMSPYYYNALTKCGIPRIKVLGTKQDWNTLEKKLYRMATEVFNSEMKTSEDYEGHNRVVKYLNNVIEIVQKIQTDNTKEFWKEMYQIDKCRSGHTNFVKGWINKLYNSGQGNDFYNYEPHISIVSYKDIDSQKEYELRCGLLFSSIEQDASELDLKYPWLVPHFAHIVLDKSVKMTVEQYKNYIDKAVTGEYHTLITGFFDVLKDDQILLGSKAERPKQRLEIVGRQLDYWTAQPDLITEIDFSSPKFEVALGYHCSKTLRPEMESLLSKLKTFFDTCQIRSVNIDVNSFHEFEDRIIQLLVGNAHLEDLTLNGYELYEWINEDTDDEERIFPAINALCSLLSHPQCRLKSLKITGNPRQGSSVALAKALLSMERPLEQIELQTVEDIDLADAIFELAAKGHLKRLRCEESRNNVEANKKILLAIAASRTLEDTQIFSIGRECPLDIFEELAKNLPQNTNLKSLKLKVIGFRNDYYNNELLNRLLSIPSLQKLDLEPSTDFGFLSNTPLLQYLKAGGSGLQLAKFLQSDTCQLQHLNLYPSRASFLDELGEALVTNKSLQKLELNASGDKSREKVSTKFGQYLATALTNRIPLRDLRIEYYLHIEYEATERIIQAIIHHPYIERLVISHSEVNSEQGMEYVIDLVKTNKTIKELFISESYSAKAPNWTEEQQKRLIEALAQSETLIGFRLPRVPTSQYKQKSNPPLW